MHNRRSGNRRNRYSGGSIENNAPLNNTLITEKEAPIIVTQEKVTQPSMITADFLASSAILGGLIVGGVLTNTLFTTALVPMTIGMGVMIAGKCYSNHMKNNHLTKDIDLLNELVNTIGAAIFVTGSYYAFPHILESGLNYISANIPPIDNKTFYDTWLMTKDLFHLSSFISALTISSIPNLAAAIANNVGNSINPNKVEVEKSASGLKSAIKDFPSSYVKYYTDRVLMVGSEFAAPVAGAVGGALNSVISVGVPKNFKSLFSMMATSATGAFNYSLYTLNSPTTMANDGAIFVGNEAATLAFGKASDGFVNTVFENSKISTKTL